MMKRKENLNRLLKKLSTYGLNPQDYVVYGSAPMVVAGYVDDVNDLDVVIRPEAWPFKREGRYDDGEIEFFVEWNNGDGTMTPAEDLIRYYRMNEPYEGHYFVDPIKVLEYKRNLGRDKDKDIWSRYK